MFQSQREDSHFPAAGGWHLHQSTLYGRPPERHKLMRSPGDIRNRFVRQDKTKRTNDTVSHLIQRSFITLHCCIFQVKATFDFYTWPPPNWVQLQIQFRTWLLTAWTNQVSQQSHITSSYDMIWFTWTERAYSVEAVIVPDLGQLHREWRDSQHWDCTLCSDWLLQKWSLDDQWMYTERVYSCRTLLTLKLVFCGGRKFGPWILSCEAL